VHQIQQKPERSLRQSERQNQSGLGSGTDSGLRGRHCPLSSCTVWYGTPLVKGKCLVYGFWLTYESTGQGKSVRNSPTSPEGRAGRGRGELQLTPEIPLQPLESTTLEQVFPFLLWRGPWWNRYPYRSPWRTHSRADLALKDCSLERTYAGTGKECEEDGVAERSCYRLTGALSAGKTWIC